MPEFKIRLATELDTSQALSQLNELMGKGTKIYFDEPDASGYTGVICTAQGSPGTWKRFGEIE